MNDESRPMVFCLGTPITWQDPFQGFAKLNTYSQVQVDDSTNAKVWIVDRLAFQEGHARHSQSAEAPPRTSPLCCGRDTLPFEGNCRMEQPFL